MSDDRKEKQARIIEMRRVDAKHKAMQEQTMKVVAEAERVIAEINEALAAQDRIFAQHNITKEQLLAYLKKVGGPAMELQVQEKMERLKVEIKERAAAELLKKREDDYISQRPRRLRNLI
ncbi:MAG TPA: hypothetical protein VK832_04380 [Burkholderiaceae bacterium]|jgi:hypothetical protein|nr:hypothetical protein [Burkholderiaceae bacterium]